MPDQTGKGMFRLQESQGHPRAPSCPKEMVQDMCPPQHESQNSIWGTTGSGFVLSPFLGLISRISLTPCKLFEDLELMDLGPQQMWFLPHSEYLFSHYL